ncbi:MAG: DUF1569 domain-containing protein [Balneolaceae bacterium]|nr:MAG: DUF1569 domain-containing protein [Balneolaceae bacterium]
MKYLFNPETRNALLERIGKLDPVTPPRWGKMTPHEMVCHLIDHYNMAVNPKPVRVRKSILLYQPLKWFAIYHAPIPRGRLKAPEEMRLTKPDNWDQDIDRLKSLVEQFASMQGETDWPDNIIAGTMDGNSWSALLYRHTIHHLKQFGC